MLKRAQEMPCEKPTGKSLQRRVRKKLSESGREKKRAVKNSAKERAEKATEKKRTEKAPGNEPIDISTVKDCQGKQSHEKEHGKS